ncbi:MAG: DUF5947 family protein [Dehalococcoidia bacterium]
MNSGPSPAEPRPFTTLRRFVRERTPAERCELCNAPLRSEHQHLLEPLRRQLLCACEPCAILFNTQGETRYKRVPRRLQYLPDFRMTDAQWDGLMIPINVAFFFESSPTGKVLALYPSPAGATESLLSLEAWGELKKENPILRELEPDVEALLVYRLGETRDYYRVPIDQCYKLVGLIRTNWRGLSGGREVWRGIAAFFAGLKERSSPRGKQIHA